ncbi:hypothetical protein [Enterococcus ureasiticus]|uniref:Uncharacterized protein n=1 Tax=Enterococcus ureasiticus TaxID=903984 RepID=A0A1E5GEA1_9ENTE|nr:hypothetical protein [Enterococcus ureasiticus]OEG10987.1 hypothetical protein BCR21_11945 [Enterococcus ureasiticus]
MLSNKIENIKQKYYIEKNLNDYKEKCGKVIELPKEIKQFCKENNIEIQPFSPENEPSMTWYFKFSQYVEENFSVTYSTKFELSKLENICSLIHYAEIPNRDPERMDSKFLVDAEDGFCFSQVNLEEAIFSALKDLDRLYLMDNFREVSDLVFSEDVTLFGPVVTYFDLAFRDMIEDIHLKKS